MLVLGIIIGLVWYFTGMVGFIYWSNYFAPELQDEWNQDEVLEMTCKALLGPVNWIIGYIAYRLK
jgi:hypothetical protein